MIPTDNLAALLAEAPDQLSALVDLEILVLRARMQSTTRRRDRLRTVNLFMANLVAGYPYLDITVPSLLARALPYAPSRSFGVAFRDQMQYAVDSRDLDVARVMVDYVNEGVREADEWTSQMGHLYGLYDAQFATLLSDRNDLCVAVGELLTGWPERARPELIRALGDLPLLAGQINNSPSIIKIPTPTFPGGPPVSPEAGGDAWAITPHLGDVDPQLARAINAARESGDVSPVRWYFVRRLDAFATMTVGSETIRHEALPADALTGFLFRHPEHLPSMVASLVDRSLPPQTRLWISDVIDQLRISLVQGEPVAVEVSEDLPLTRYLEDTCLGTRLETALSRGDVAAVVAEARWLDRLGAGDVHREDWEGFGSNGEQGMQAISHLIRSSDQTFASDLLCWIADGRCPAPVRRALLDSDVALEILAPVALAEGLDAQLPQYDELAHWAVGAVEPAHQLLSGFHALLQHQEDEADAIIGSLAWPVAAIMECDDEEQSLGRALKLGATNSHALDALFTDALTFPRDAGEAQEARRKVLEALEAEKIVIQRESSAQLKDHIAEAVETGPNASLELLDTLRAEAIQRHRTITRRNELLAEADRIMAGVLEARPEVADRIAEQSDMRRLGDAVSGAFTGKHAESPFEAAMQRFPLFAAAIKNSPSRVTARQWAIDRAREAAAARNRDEGRGDDPPKTVRPGPTVKPPAGDDTARQQPAERDADERATPGGKPRTGSDVTSEQTHEREKEPRLSTTRRARLHGQPGIPVTSRHAPLGHACAPDQDADARRASTPRRHSTTHSSGRLGRRFATRQDGPADGRLAPLHGATDVGWAEAPAASAPPPTGEAPLSPSPADVSPPGSEPVTMVRAREMSAVAER